KTLAYIFPQWPMLLAILACTLAFTVTAALEPWPMKLLVDHVLGDRGVPQGMQRAFDALGLTATPINLLIVAVLSSLGRFGINGAWTVLVKLGWSLGGQRMVYALAGDLFARLQRLSLLFHGRSSIGDSLTRLTDDTWCVYKVADGMLMAPFRQICTLLVT